MIPVQIEKTDSIALLWSTRFNISLLFRFRFVYVRNHILYIKLTLWEMDMKIKKKLRIRSLEYSCNVMQGRVFVVAVSSNIEQNWA